jgi:hypothetical protein
MAAQSAFEFLENLELSHSIMKFTNNNLGCSFSYTIHPPCKSVSNNPVKVQPKHKMQPCFAYQKHTLIEDTNKALVFHRRQQSEPHDALLYHKKKLQVVLSQARVMLPHGRARAELLHGRWGQAPRELIGAELLMAFPGLRSSMAEVLPIRREQSWMPYSASSPLLLFNLLQSIFFKKTFRCTFN